MAGSKLTVVEVTDIHGTTAEQLMADVDFTSVVYSEEEERDAKGRVSKHVRTQYFDADDAVIRELYDGEEVEIARVEAGETDELANEPEE